MLTKQNMDLNEETIIGLRAIKAAVEECGGVNKVQITQDLLRICCKFSQAVHRASESRKYKEKKERKKLKSHSRKHTKENIMK